MFFPNVFSRYRRGPGFTPSVVVGTGGYFPAKYWPDRYFTGVYWPHTAAASSGGSGVTPSTPNAITAFITGRRGHRHPGVMNAIPGRMKMVWVSLCG